MTHKSISIDADLHARVKAATKREAMKIAPLVERLLREWLSKIDRGSKRKAG